MKRNSFLKLDLGKIILLLVLILSTYLIPKSTELCYVDSGGLNCLEVNVEGIGYPVFYGQEFRGEELGLEFRYYIFILNVLIYYFLSCIIVFIISKFFEKR
jgi:hypothetical protein